jgi:glutamate dehydrogenase/leucine dehydrogenase
MGWIMDTYSMLEGHTIQGVVTGKPLEIGGSPGRTEAAGRATMIITREILKKLKMPMEKTRIVIQGMGHVGRAAAKLIHEQGSTIIGVSDGSGGIYKESGLDIPSILRFLSTKGNLLKNYKEPGIKHISNQELLALDTDVLIPAALENQINEDNAANIKTRVIVEAANGPTTVGADKILHDKGIIVVPDILAGAGGITASYFEWVQNLQSFFWSEDEINEKLNGVMSKAFETVYEIHREKHVTLRTSAYMTALKKLAAARKVRGLFP